MARQQMRNEDWITREHAQALAQRVLAGQKLTFQFIGNRDWVAKLAGKRGLRKYSYKNQQLDPRYTVEGSHMPNLGLGNDYKHFFSTIYCLEKERW